MGMETKVPCPEAEDYFVVVTACLRCPRFISIVRSEEGRNVLTCRVDGGKVPLVWETEVL